MFPSNQVIRGDSTQVLRVLPNDSVDFVLSDPPYGVRYQDREGRTVANDDDLSNVLPAFNELYRVLKPNTYCVSFYGWNRVDEFMRAWRSAGFRVLGHIVWSKDYPSNCRFLRTCHEQAYLLGKGRPTPPEHPIDDVRAWEFTGNVVHPTEKAVSILKPLIKTFSQPGDVVLDPFCGAGSTLLAAAACGRRYLGIELEEKYCSIAEQRLRDLSTDQPVTRGGIIRAA